MNRTIRSLRHSLLLGVIAILAFTATYTSGQSTDEARPTPIVTFPVTGNLGSGTYYFQMPASLVLPGTGNAVLEFTPPDGGGSMTVTFSGPTCCPPDAYIGVTTGLSDPIREAARFNIPRAQPLLITVYISAGAKQTVRFRLNFHIAKSGDGGIIVTPPPSPTPTPSATPTPSPTTCTDLGLAHFSVVEVTSLRKVIKGMLGNVSTTAFSGARRLQWVEVVDITNPVKGPVLVGRQPFTDVPARGTINYSVEHRLTTPHRTRYEVRIVYSPYNATDRRDTNDDCRSSNNTTRFQRTDGGDVLILDELPDR